MKKELEKKKLELKTDDRYFMLGTFPKLNLHRETMILMNEWLTLMDLPKSSEYYQDLYVIPPSNRNVYNGNINSFVKGKEFVHSQTNENRGYQYQKKDYYYDNTHNRQSYRNDRCTHYDEMENKSYIRKEERNKSNLLSTEYVAITKEAIANEVLSLLEKKGIFDDKKESCVRCPKTTNILIQNPESNIALKNPSVIVKCDKPNVATMTDHWSEHYIVKAPSKLKKEMLKRQAKGILRELSI